jgi:hypothetical protein
VTFARVCKRRAKNATRNVHVVQLVCLAVPRDWLTAFQAEADMSALLLACVSGAGRELSKERGFQALMRRVELRRPARLVEASALQRTAIFHPS